ARSYDEFQSAVSLFRLNLPPHLIGASTHLDPDFSMLTYGDQGRRAKQIRQLGCGDLLVFYAGMRDVNPNKQLVYAIIGLYVINEIVRADSVEKRRWPENAHTRRIPNPTDIVVRAKPRVSGRLKTCILIGEYRRRAYRVRSDLLKAWGDLNVRDGYLQRSARL